MTKLFERPETKAMLARCVRREHSRCEFWPSKLTNPGTVEQWGETYKDETGLRASLFYFTHEDTTTTRSVQRIVTNVADFRLTMPSAIPRSNLFAKVRIGLQKFSQNWRR